MIQLKFRDIKYPTQGPYDITFVLFFFFGTDNLPGAPTSVFLTSPLNSLPQPSHETITKAAPSKMAIVGPEIPTDPQD